MVHTRDSSMITSPRFATCALETASRVTFYAGVELFSVVQGAGDIVDSSIDAQEVITGYRDQALKSKGIIFKLHCC